MKPWHEHPNAKHIDRIVESTVSHPASWVKLYRTPMKGSDELLGPSSECWLEARDRIPSDLVSDTLGCLTAQTPDEIFYIITDPVIALLAYEDCAYMLDSDPDELALLAAFGNGAARLMYPAAVVFNSVDKA